MKPLSLTDIYCNSENNVCLMLTNSWKLKKKNNLAEINTAETAGTAKKNPTAMTCIRQIRYHRFFFTEIS